MASAADLIHDLVSDGRLRTIPYTNGNIVRVVTINLDHLHTSLAARFTSSFTNWDNLVDCYSGNHNDCVANITTDVHAMMDLAVLCCYNRLRSVAKMYAPVTMTERMSARAPASKCLEFPTFLSFMLQSIGPLRITDAHKNVVIIYAPPSGTMDNFGRSTAVNVNFLVYQRLIEALRQCNVPCTPLDSTPDHGAFWTTCALEVNEGLLNVIAPFHSSHYTREDVFRFLSVADVLHRTDVFEECGYTLGYVNDEETIAALAVIDGPNDIPTGQTATSAGRPVGLANEINLFDIIQLDATSLVVDANAYLPATLPGKSLRLNVMLSFQE